MIEICVRRRSRPVLQVAASLVLPESIQRQAASIDVSVCFRVTSRRYKGAIGLLAWQRLARLA